MTDPTIYTVGWICALTIELVAAQVFLDEEHTAPDYIPTNDNNSYTLGRIGAHNVVIAALPHRQYGLVSAAAVARDMVRTFTNVRICLMAGIGGGAPSKGHDVRLGDVVGSIDNGKGGIFQYDYGKAIQNKELKITGHLNQPPQFILTAITQLEAKYDRPKEWNIGKAIREVIERDGLDKYQRPDPSTDLRFKKTFLHIEKKEASEREMGDEETEDEEIESEEVGCAETCAADKSNLVSRRERKDGDNPTIHYGLIASANQLMKDALTRDRLARKEHVLCFEMEAAGLANHFPCLVVRGICDYSDTHKNDSWQRYAAMAAAAYARDLVRTIAAPQIDERETLSEILGTGFSEVNQSLERVESGVVNVQTGLTSLQRGKHFKSIKNWLSPPEPSTNFNRALESRHEGTGSWFLGCEEYRAWKTENKSFLWLHGIPGSGKTVLASTIIENLKETIPKSLLYFYFDFTDTQKQSLENALRSLIFQLYEKRDDTRGYLDSLHKSDPGKPDIGLLTRAFQSMVEQSGELWIVLDALDECATKENAKKGLLPWIKSLWKLETNVRFLVTSRPEQDITSAIEELKPPASIIPLRSSVIGDDIYGYIKARIDDSEEFGRWKADCWSDVRKEMRETLGRKADGMFRLAACQLDVLEHCLDYQAVQQGLKTLPDTLDDMYNRILKSAFDVYGHRTIRILQFLIYSNQPLSIDQLVDAIAVKETDDTKFDTMNRMPIAIEIMKCCSSLVSMTRTQRDGQMRIQLAHYSVKEYLVSGRLSGDLADDFLEVNARASIANVCLAYLMYLGPQAPVDPFFPQDILNWLKRDYPLAMYAVQHWPRHAKVAEANLESTRTLLKDFFLCEETFKLYIVIWLFTRRLDRDTEWALIREYGQQRLGRSNLPRLIIASRHGLVLTAKHLIEGGADVNARCEFLETWDHISRATALHCAAERGDEKLVELLIDNGADMVLEGDSALAVAAYEGRGNICQKLLDKGADINAVDEYLGTALLAAAYSGHEDIIKILLDNKADINAQGNDYGTALQAAAYSGHGNIIKILLDNQADVNAQGGRFGTPLQAAIHCRRVDNVKLLLDRGAHVNDEGSLYSSALLEAGRKEENEDIVEVLVEYGALIDTRDPGWEYLTREEENLRKIFRRLLKKEDKDEGVRRRLENMINFLEEKYPRYTTYRRARSQVTDPMPKRGVMDEDAQPSKRRKVMD